MGKFLERAEIHAPLILLPASVRSFESPFYLMPATPLMYNTYLFTNFINLFHLLRDRTGKTT
jgi:hypothetical protein